MSDESRGRAAGLLVGWAQSRGGARAAAVEVATLDPREELSPLVVDLLDVAGHLVDLRADELGVPTSTVPRDVVQRLEED